MLTGAAGKLYVYSFEILRATDVKARVYRQVGNMMIVQTITSAR